MNGVRSIQRSANKVDELIQYGLDYTSQKYLKKIKHSGNNKLIFYKDFSDEIVVHYRVPLFSFHKMLTFRPSDKNRTININGTDFDVLKYDKSEIFNLSTIHDTNMLQWLQVFCSCTESRKRTLKVSKQISQNLLYEAHSAFSTQYERIDPEKYQIYRER